ncbi:MAG TPA: metallophosphoesterase [Kofleriaceae bacterium]|jgi:3',5'-cyclic AMP phosphodiesterase CpdA|nr:metallophosphoesterase [Kofleriaceae bacterium]
MLLAHCSDLHLLSLDGTRLLDFANKRWIGGLNLLTNRGRHYHTEAFEQMVEDFGESKVDHVICTGDVTNLAFEQEFRYARERFDRIPLGTHGVTVLPGNHDTYVAEGEQHFHEIFAPYFASDAGWPEPWPTVRIRGDVALIGLSTSRKTPWFTAYGVCDDDQLARLAEALTDPRVKGKCRVVALHHPPAGRRAQSRIRGLRDHEAFAAVLAQHGCELVLHGHEHRDLRNELPGPSGPIPVLGVPSGTYGAADTTRTARYRVIELDGGGVRAHHLRVWRRDQNRFEIDDAEPGLVAATA